MTLAGSELQQLAFLCGLGQVTYQAYEAQFPHLQGKKNNKTFLIEFCED